MVDDEQLVVEQRWHAVDNTLGVDFAKKEYGGTILTSDNQGNVYKGAFDPNCAGTDEKWKKHHTSNAFGVEQHLDPVEDRYYHGEETHGAGELNNSSSILKRLNTRILQSIQDRPMTWNLWNVVRHYAFIKYFKNQGRLPKNEAAAWDELESRTRRLVRGIYRTFQQNKGDRNTFHSVDELSNHSGGPCVLNWTNSFVEITSALERNAREHAASFVLFTGDNRPVSETDARNRHPMDNLSLSVAECSYEDIKKGNNNFLVQTLDGVDGENDGTMPKEGDKGYQGHRYNDYPTDYIVGDVATYRQQLEPLESHFAYALDLDATYPYAENLRGSTTQRWVRRIYDTVLNRQILPVYTSMETMDKDVHEVTDDELKGITFQVIPQLYWKYEWTCNDYMIHRVGKLSSNPGKLEFYDMLGNVWEWVRDDWTESIQSLGNGSVNPIAGSEVGSDIKVIKGGAFDQLIRKVISPSREGLGVNSCQSANGT